MRHRFGLVLLVAVASAGCSDRTLTRDRAASLITTLEGFTRDAHVTIQTGVPLQSAFKCLSQAEVERTPLSRFVMDRGWIRYETREAAVGFGMKASCPAMVLTSAGRAASARWTRGRTLSSEGTAWSVPIGWRELVAVTAIATTPDESSQVEYEWKWTPNDTGMALRSFVPEAAAFFDQRRKARASCRRSNDGWECRLGMWTSAADALGELSP